MATQDELRSLDLELDRVVDRLNSMPLSRAASASAECHALADAMLARTRGLADEIPSRATLPYLDAQGLGSLIAVIGQDYLNAAKAAPQSDVRPVVDGLIELRRSLP